MKSCFFYLSPTLWFYSSVQSRGCSDWLRIECIILMSYFKLLQILHVLLWMLNSINIWKSLGTAQINAYSLPIECYLADNMRWRENLLFFLWKIKGNTDVILTWMIVKVMLSGSWAGWAFPSPVLILHDTHFWHNQQHLTDT